MVSIHCTVPDRLETNPTFIRPGDHAKSTYHRFTPTWFRGKGMRGVKDGVAIRASPVE